MNSGWQILERVMLLLIQKGYKADLVMDLEKGVIRLETDIKDVDRAILAARLGIVSP